MTQLALVSPKGPLYRHDGGIFRKSLRAAPLTLTTLAALIPDDLDISCKIYDEGIETLPGTLDADLIGMTVITGCAPRAYELAAHYRAAGSTVVMGGPHVTLVPDEAAQNADSIVVGYAEKVWPELLRDYLGGRLRQRYTMATDFNFDNPETLPFPKRELLHGKAYQTIHTFEATRGCVHNCDFCVVPSAWGRRPFQKPVAHVVADIRQSGAKRIVFYDLNLIANRAYAVELFEALVLLKIKWFGLATTLIDNGMAELMGRSGCKGLLIGFESLSESVLNQCDKRFNRPNSYRDLVLRLKDQGILINGTFVFGNDDDSVDAFDAVMDFVLTNDIELPRFSILTPFPGTPLFQRLETEGRITSRDWSLYDGQHVVFEPKGMSQRELQEGHERIWREVYSYKNIVRRTANEIFKQLSFGPVIVGANLGYRFYAHNLRRFYTCSGGIA